MTEYGEFATLVATVSSLVAASVAILFGFQKRARWQPPEEAVSVAVSRLASLLTAVGIAILYVFAKDMARWMLAAVVILFLIMTLCALLVAISTNVKYSYFFPAERNEKNRKLGGDRLTDEAEKIRKKKGMTIQDMFLDSHGDKDLVWTRDSQASVSIRSTLSFIFLIGGGGCCLAAAGMLVATTVAK